MTSGMKEGVSQPRTRTSDPQPPVSVMSNNTLQYIPLSQIAQGHHDSKPFETVGFTTKNISQRRNGHLTTIFLVRCV